MVARRRSPRRRAPPLIHVRFLQWEPPDAHQPTMRAPSRVGRHSGRRWCLAWADGEHHANWSGASKDRKKTVGAAKGRKRLQAAVAEARRT